MQRINPSLTSSELIGEWLQQQVDMLIEEYETPDMSVEELYHAIEQDVKAVYADWWKDYHMANTEKWYFAYIISGDTITIVDACHAQNMYNKDKWNETPVSFAFVFAYRRMVVCVYANNRLGVRKR